MRTVVALIAFGTLCAGCVPPTLVIPDPSIPHRLASDATVTIEVAHPSGQVERQKVKVPAGWWVASDAVANGEVP